MSRDISVIRLQLDQPLAYYPGQYVTVQVPQWPRRWRYLSPAMPPDPAGGIEFHVRSVTGGMVSPTIVTETHPATVGGCQTRTAACRSTGTAVTCLWWRAVPGWRRCGRSSWTSPNGA